MENIKNKIIIRNYTDLEDIQVLYYIELIVREGKVSETKNGKQYCFVTTFSNGINVSCDKRNNTHTFYVYYNEEGKNGKFN